MEAFDIDYLIVVQQGLVELVAAHIYGKDPPCAVLERAIREPAGGSADIQDHLAGKIQLEGPDRLFEFEPSPADFIVIDVSFISLEYVFPFLGPFLQPGGRIVALIKPQFEMKGRRRFKNGIIKDEKVRGEALEMVKGYASASGYTLLNFVPTFEDRQEKNVEYLGLFVVE